MNHEIDTTSKNEVSQRRLVISSPLMEKGKEEGKLIDDSLFINYGFLIYSILKKYVKMFSLNKNVSS